MGHSNFPPWKRCITNTTTTCQWRLLDLSSPWPSSHWSFSSSSFFSPPWATPSPPQAAGHSFSPPPTSGSATAYYYREGHRFRCGGWRACTDMA